MLDKLYYQLVEIIFYWGIIGVLIEIGIFSVMIIYQYEYGDNKIIKSIEAYFLKTNIATIIFYQFLYFISQSALYYSLIILVLYYLKPNHKIITDQVDVYSRVLLYDDKPGKWYTIIPFGFQVLALLFYFEILEFNFCDLNRNTVKNILIRESRENENKNEGRTLSQHRAEFDGEYYIECDGLNNSSNYEQKESIDTDKNHSLIQQENINSYPSSLNN